MPAVVPIWMNNFNQKLYTRPELQEYLLMHEIEMQRYFDETNSYNEQGNYQEWIKAFNSPELYYAILNDRITLNADKVKTILSILKERSIVLLIIGVRGSGKTALALYLAEELHKTGMIIAIVQSTIPNLPEWIVEVESPQDAPTGSFIIYDEASITMNARKAMSKQNIDVSAFLAISRHQNKTICFISQHSNIVDPNILRMADMFLFKMPSFFEIYDKGFMKGRGSSMLRRYIARMCPTKPEQTLFTDFSRWYKLETPLPSFWSEDVSKTYSKLSKSEAVEECVRLFSKGMNAKQIQRQLIPRGIEWSETEIKNAYTNPNKVKANLKQLKPEPDLKQLEPEPI